MRFRGWEIGSLFWVGLALGVVVAFVWGWWRSRASWLGQKEAMVRLDAELGLFNALTTAAERRGSWPDPGLADRVVSWRFGHLLVPVLAALVFFGAGFWIPIAPAKEGVDVSEPYRWGALERAVAELVRDEMVDESYEELMREKLKQLREQDEENWFSGASLEATDALMKEHASEMREVREGLEEMSGAMKRLAEDRLSEEEREALREGMEEALKGLRDGRMKPNQDLLEKLAEAAKKGMDGMNEEEQRRLRERMEELAKEFREREPGGG